MSCMKLLCFVKKYVKSRMNEDESSNFFMTQNVRPVRWLNMRTFSAMSTPDKILTRHCYLLELFKINFMITNDNLLLDEQVAKMKKEASRLQILIDAIDADLLSE
jgi:hypothetical protein